MKTIEKDFIPICPFCEKELEKLIRVKRGWFELNQIICCPHCRKIVGTASND